MGKIIEAKNVIKEYGSFKNPFQALKGINLDIRRRRVSCYNGTFWFW